MDAEAAGTATVASFTQWLTTKSPSLTDRGVGLMREWLPARLVERAADEWEMGEDPAVIIGRGGMGRSIGRGRWRWTGRWRSSCCRSR